MLATALAAVLYMIGWIVGVVAVAVAWAWSAIAVGWDDAHALSVPHPDQPELRPVPAWPAERAG